MSCRKSTTQVNEEITHADSVISRNTDLLFSNPRQAIRVLDSLQANLTDSAAWYKTEVFKATAHNLLGDTTLANSLYVKIENWCEKQNRVNPISQDWYGIIVA